jgi:hypothetical protein
MMYTVGSDDQRLLELLSETREAEFLFRADVNDYIKELMRKAHSSSSMRDQMSAILDPAVTDPAHNARARQVERMEWAKGQGDVVVKKFKRYLDFSKL